MMRKFYKKNKQDVELNLTSLMDMFTIILFFFLSTYSFEGVLMKLVEGIELPRSESKIPVAEKYFLAIKKDKIVIGDEEFELKSSDDKYVFNNLRLIKKKGINFLVIQADKDLPFAVVKKYIRLAVQAGFAKPYLAVIPK